MRGAQAAVIARNHFEKALQHEDRVAPGGDHLSKRGVNLDRPQAGARHERCLALQGEEALRKVGNERAEVAFRRVGNRCKRFKHGSLCVIQVPVDFVCEVSVEVGLVSAPLQVVVEPSALRERVQHHDDDGPTFRVRDDALDRRPVECNAGKDARDFIPIETEVVGVDDQRLIRPRERRESQSELDACTEDDVEMRRNAAQKLFDRPAQVVAVGDGFGVFEAQYPLEREIQKDRAPKGDPLRSGAVDAQELLDDGSPAQCVFAGQRRFDDGTHDCGWVRGVREIADARILTAGKERSGKDRLAVSGRCHDPKQSWQGLKLRHEAITVDGRDERHITPAPTGGRSKHRAALHARHWASDSFFSDRRSFTVFWRQQPTRWR